MKDSRIKCCSNCNCEHNKNRKDHRYSAADRFCTACGSELTFACKGCLGPVIDQGPDHKLCSACEAERADKKARREDAGKKVIATVSLGLAATVTFIAKHGKEAAEAATKIVRK